MPQETSSGESRTSNNSAKTSTGRARKAPKAASENRTKARSAKPDNGGRNTIEMPSASTLGKIAIAAATITGAAFMAWKQLRSSRNKQDGHDQYSPAAFAGDETHPENFDQTRSAGPDAMRDDTGEDWDEVDQGLDESFPASDPAAKY